MENIVIVSSLILAVSSLLPWYKLNQLKSTVINFILFLLLFGMALVGFKVRSDGSTLIFILASILLINQLISLKTEKKGMLLIAVVSSFALVFWQQVTTDFLGYPISFSVGNALLIPVFACLLPQIVHYKANFISKYLSVEKKQLLVALHFIGIGMLVQFALFFGGAFGLFLAAFGYFLSEMYLRESNFSVLLISIAFLNYFFQLKGIESGSLFQGNVLIGLFFGLGIAYLFSSGKETWKPLTYLSMIFVSLLLIAGIIFVGFLKEHAGGMSSFAGLITGFLVLSSRFNVENRSYLLFLVSVTLSVGLLASSKLVSGKPANRLQHEMNMNLDHDEGIILPLETIEELPEKVIEDKQMDSIRKPVNPLLGEWKINPLASKLNFELGPPEARTQGEFSQVHGLFFLTEQLNTNRISVELPLKFFTTYNDFRDESLFSKDFLDMEKQAVLTFESLSWRQVGKKYRVEGNFKMKGLTNRVVVDLKILSNGKDQKGAYVKVAGSSSIDRTKYEMTSDPKIGDLVDFSFQLELRKK